MKLDLKPNMKLIILFLMLFLFNLSFAFTDNNGNEWTPSGDCVWNFDGYFISSKSTGQLDCYLTLTENVEAREPFIFTTYMANDGSEHGIRVGGQYIRRVGSNYQILTGTNTYTINYPFGNNWKVIYNGENYYFFVNEVLLKKWQAISNGIFQLVDDRNSKSSKIYQYSDVSLKKLSYTYDSFSSSYGIPDEYCYSGYNKNGVLLGVVNPDEDIDCCLMNGHMSAGFYSYPVIDGKPCCNGNDNWCASFGCCVNGVWKKGYSCLKDSDCANDGCYGLKYRDYSCKNGKCVYTETCSTSCSGVSCCSDNDCPLTSESQASVSQCISSGYPTSYCYSHFARHYSCITHSGQSYCSKVVKEYDYSRYYYYDYCVNTGDVSCSSWWNWVYCKSACDVDDCAHTINCDAEPYNCWYNWVQYIPCKEGYLNCNPHFNYGETDGCETKVSQCNVYCKYENNKWDFWWTDCYGDTSKYRSDC